MDVRRSWSLTDFIGSRELPIMAEAMPEPSDRCAVIIRGLLLVAGRARGELCTEPATAMSVAHIEAPDL